MTKMQDVILPAAKQISKQLKVKEFRVIMSGT